MTDAGRCRPNVDKRQHRWSDVQCGIGYLLSYFCISLGKGKMLVFFLGANDLLRVTVCDIEDTIAENYGCVTLQRMWHPIRNK